MTETFENDQSLAGEYALGLLGVDEVRAFEARLAKEPELREIYAAWCETLVRLPVKEVLPPFYVKTEIDSQLFGSARPFWQRFGKLIAGAGAVMAAVAVAGYLNFATPQPDYIAQVSAGDAVAFQAAAHEDSRVLRVSALVSTPPVGRAHELWIVPEQGAPVSLGILAAGEVVIPGGFDLKGALLAISVEAEGGSSTGAPTTTPIAAAPLADAPEA